MSSKYSTALSHLVLAGTGIYCLTVYKTHGFAYASFGVIVANSLVGVWRYGNPDYGYKVDGLYKFTSVLQTLFALPCIMSQIWLNYGYQTELAYAHILVSVIPLTAYLANKYRTELTDIILGINTISLGAVSIMNQNYFGIAAALSYGFDHFVIKSENVSYFDIPSQDLYNYAMCFFTFFGLRAVSD